MRSIFVLLSILLNSLCFAQLGQTGFNNVYSVISKVSDDQSDCYVNWLQSLPEENKGMRWPGGSSSMELTNTAEYWRNLTNFIHTHQEAGVNRIMYVATMDQDEMSMEAYKAIKLSFDNSNCEYSNENWLQTTFIEDIFIRIGLADAVYEQKAKVYARKFLAFADYCTRNGLEFDKDELIWAAPYPSSSHNLKYLTTLDKILGNKGYTSCSVHFYPSSYEDLQYLIKRSKLIPDRLKVHGTEMSFDFSYNAKLGVNDHIAFSDEHRRTLIDMFAYFNTIFSSTWYHYGVGSSDSNYPAFVMVDGGDCQNRLSEFIKQQQ